MSSARVKSKTIIHILFIAAVVIISGGCGKRAIHLDPNFIGVWVGHSGTDSYQLSIDETNMAYWQMSSGGHYTYAQGSARVKNGELHIGLKRFHIDEFPTQDPGLQTWHMRLEGIWYIR